MHPQLVEAAITFLGALLMAVYVTTRGQRTATHWLLLALLASILFWTGGVIGRRSVSDPDWLRAWTTVSFLGCFGAPTAWLLLAARTTRVEVFEERPGLSIALAVPSLLSFLGVLTNSGHRLFLRDLSPEALLGGPQSYGGPLLWVAAAWGYLLVLAGAALFTVFALRMLGQRERARGAALALAGVMPLVTSSGYVFGYLHAEYDLTPMVMGFSVMLFFSVHWRDQLFDTLPVARRDVVEQLPDAVVVAGRDGRILDLNPAARRLLRGQGCVGAHLAVALGSLGPAPRGTHYDSLVADLGEVGTPAWLEIESSEGRILELSAAPVHGLHRETGGFYAVLRDLTEKRRSEEFLRRNQRLETVAGLAAGIAHEVNNPLSFVRSNLGHIERVLDAWGAEPDSMRKRGSGSVEELRSVVRESVEGIDRIGRIVDRMRRFSRVDAEELSEVDLRSVVLDALKLADLQDPQDIEMDLHLDERLPAVRASREHLVQVVLNLLVNARQAVQGEPDAALRVSLRRGRDGVELHVVDNGPGVPAAVEDRIFDPFFTTKGPGEGTGLGLSIAYDILREHGGALRLDRSGDRGAHFVAFVPFA